MKFYSQYGQDKYVIDRLDNMKNGFFVDVGAAHPTHISNTYTMESELQWSGLLIEADDYYVTQLQQKRTSLVINTLIYNKELNNIEYVLTGKKDQGFGNHIKNFGVPHAIRIGSVLKSTTTLQKVLCDNNAPQIIDYFSVDVEGAELEVLQSVDLDMYKFTIMTIEENNRMDKILSYLQPYGYILDAILQTPGLNEKELVVTHKDLI